MAFCWELDPNNLFCLMLNAFCIWQDWCPNIQTVTQVWLSPLEQLLLSLFVDGVLGFLGLAAFFFIAWNMPDSSQEAVSFTLKLTLCSYFCELIRSICFQVLDAGKIHAYDEPYTLLQDPTNIFYKMVQQTGKQEAAALLEAAKKVSLTQVLHT